MKKSWSVILDLVSIIRMILLGYFELAPLETQTPYLLKDKTA